MALTAWASSCSTSLWVLAASRILGTGRAQSRGQIKARGGNIKAKRRRDGLADEGVGHDAELLDLGALLLRQVLHGLLGVEAGPAGAVALDLPLVLPGLERALEGLRVKSSDAVLLGNLRGTVQKRGFTLSLVSICARFLWTISTMPGGWTQASPSTCTGTPSSPRMVIFTWRH